jgi:Putative beta-barrel porin-2, OmpL-like. bbp2
MKLSKLAMLAAVACGLNTAGATIGYTNDIELTSCLSGKADCGCESLPAGCDGEAGCDTSGCDGVAGSGCGAGDGCLTGELGDPWKLFSDLPEAWDMGGWVSTGYHTDARPIFNDRPDELNLHQAWLYAQRSIDTSAGFDLGGRVDYLYGIDAQNTQAFGIANDHWDNSWDNGGANGYGQAMPQLYAEAGYGDLSVKIGHFFTIIGWEVVGATGNFFYSHAYTFNYSEPFTHTGALATYALNDDVSIWNGYSLGFDSGFEDNGDAYLGGMSLQLTDDLQLIYALIAGRFEDGDGVAGTQNGYMHSLIANYALTDSVQYIVQNDIRSTKNAVGDDVTDTFGVNQYLIKTLNDRWGVGGRFEWYQSEGIFSAAQSDIYALTGGLNYRPHANMLVRPEVRWDFDDDQVANLPDGDEQFAFGVDSIFTF